MTKGFVLFILFALLLVQVAFAQAPDKKIPAGRYRIKLQDGTNRALRQKSYKRGNFITEFAESGEPQTDEWDIIPYGDYFYTLKNVIFGLYLAAVRPSGNPIELAYLSGEPTYFRVGYEGGDNLTYTIQWLRTGYYFTPQPFNECTDEKFLTGEFHTPRTMNFKPFIKKYTFEPVGVITP
ncbi:hypothetical protein BGZ65_013031 [Modicella reniformis]|uniref:Uncharacterized protein n=1 Tax=Modicella reniformis TaxID=1440133 RepID=A0A9P6M153_9FUNG|nr:hypothetical protein BGZ65_013031 [Modicella reniformis]